MPSILRFVYNREHEVSPNLDDFAFLVPRGEHVGEANGDTSVPGEFTSERMERTVTMYISTAVRRLPGDALRRIELVDAIRGLAVFGILWTNIYLRSDPIQLNGLPQQSAWINWLVALTGTYKFRSMFAFLFGFGLSMQARRATNDSQFCRIYIRRMAILFVVGLLHAALLWPGDILALYALCGMLLVWFRNSNSKAMLVATVLLLTVPVVQELVGIRLYDPSVLRADVKSGYAIYQHGTFVQITARRIYDFRTFWAASLAASAPRVLAMMLLGFVFHRAGYLERSGDHLGLWRKLCLAGYGFGLPANLLFAYWKVSDSPSSTLSLAAKIAHAYGAPLLCMGYVATMVVLADTSWWRRVLVALAPIGRMSLTAYLGHSIVFSLVFCSYGLGYFGRVTPWQDVLLAFGLCFLQVGFASLWFRYLRMGPFEWIWRWMTYGQRPPLRSQTPRNPSGPMPTLGGCPPSEGRKLVNREA